MRLKGEYMLGSNGSPAVQATDFQSSDPCFEFAKERTPTLLATLQRFGLKAYAFDEYTPYQGFPCRKVRKACEEKAPVFCLNVRLEVINWRTTSVQEFQAMLLRKLADIVYAEHGSYIAIC
jgi:hypothetical protein